MLLLYGRRNNTVAAPFSSLYIIIFRGARVGRPPRGAYTFTDPLAINIAARLEATHTRAHAITSNELIPPCDSNQRFLTIRMRLLQMFIVYLE